MSRSRIQAVSVGAALALGVALAPLVGAPLNGAPNGDRATPAERAIALARTAVADRGATAEEYVALASALSRRARETADPTWYDRSDATLEAALKLAPDGFAAVRQGIWNQLGRHEFAAAYKTAKALHIRAKDDVMTYGLIVDACVELGRYEEAEDAAQWMLNLRAGTPAAMTRVSYLREQFGDVPGAIDAMRMAFHSTRPSEAEDRAWILTHLAHLEIERGKPDAAEGYARSAMRLFPDYHYALNEMARAHTLRNETREALTCYRRRYELAPHPENLFDVGVAMQAAGDTAGAIETFVQFEADALLESENVDNANLSLIEYWLDVAPTKRRMERALKLAQVRAVSRRDIATLEALAWAQHRCGEDVAANETMRAALEIGCRNARLRYRAGVIARSLGDNDAATRHFESAWSMSPISAPGQAARKALTVR